MRIELSKFEILDPNETVLNYVRTQLKLTGSQGISVLRAVIVRVALWFWVSTKK